MRSANSVLASQLSPAVSAVTVLVGVLFAFRTLLFGFIRRRTAKPM